VSERRKAPIRLAIGLLLSGVLLWLFVREADLSDVAGKLSGVSFSTLIVALGFLALHTVFYVIRSSLLLAAAGEQRPWWRLAPGIVAARGLNNVVPLRGGDLFGWRRCASATRSPRR
jgi:uncharacterized membrane protein YbhN (UPF0104 family)